MHPKKFDYILKKLGMPNVDLFASHENYQIKPYVSWMPNPAASTVDAFSIDWELIFPLITQRSLLQVGYCRRPTLTTSERT